MHRNKIIYINIPNMTQCSSCHEPSGQWDMDTWSATRPGQLFGPALHTVASHGGRTTEHTLVLVKVQCKLWFAKLWIAEFTARVLSKGKNKWHWRHSGRDQKGTQVYSCCCHGLLPNNFIHTSKKVCTCHVFTEAVFSVYGINCSKLGDWFSFWIDNVVENMKMCSVQF